MALHRIIFPMSPSAVLMLLLSVILLLDSADSHVGVCYGMLGDDLPPPSQVVSLFQHHNIPRMRLYSPSDATLDALRRSAIELTLDVPREDLKLLSTDPSAADNWISLHVAPFSPDVTFRYLAVGNELIPNTPEAQFVLPAMKNLQNVISAKNLQNRIKVSTVIDTAVLGSSYPPSAAEFTKEALDFLEPIAQFLRVNGSPLLINVYPYFSYVGNPHDVSLDFALFSSPGTVVADGSFNYQNLFDAVVDSVYVALEKIGAGDLEVVVAESGWPSDGGVAATVANAQVYNQNLIRHLPNGTPRRPGKEIETYLFAAFNENKKAPGVEQNFGLFYPSMKPVYAIDF